MKGNYIVHKERKRVQERKGKERTSLVVIVIVVVCKKNKKINVANGKSY